MDLIVKMAQRYLDRKVRSPRLEGFTVDDHMPDRGTRYGGAQTIHNTGTVDIVLDTRPDGTVYVSEVWFRCMMLAAQVSQPKGFPAYRVPGSPLVAVEVVDV